MTSITQSDVISNEPAQVPIHVALSNAMRDVQSIAKNDRNTAPGQNYMFRGIDATMNAVGPALRKHGIVPLPVGQETSYRDVKTSTGKDTREVTVKARYELVGPMGDSKIVEVPGESMDSGDKGTPKAMSVAFRTLLLQMFCVPTGDVEPDSQTYQRATAEPAGEDFAATIAQATTVVELEAVGAKLAQTEMSAARKKALRAVYTARHNELAPKAS